MEMAHQGHRSHRLCLLPALSGHALFSHRRLRREIHVLSADASQGCRCEHCVHFAHLRPRRLRHVRILLRGHVRHRFHTNKLRRSAQLSHHDTYIQQRQTGKHSRPRQLHRPNVPLCRLIPGSIRRIPTASTDGKYKRSIWLGRYHRHNHSDRHTAIRLQIPPGRKSQSNAPPVTDMETCAQQS